MTTHTEHKQRSAMAQAAEWYHRVCDPDVSVEELSNWQHWLSRDEAHRQAYEKVEELMRITGEIAAIPELPGEEELLADRYDGDLPIAHWRRLQERRPGEEDGAASSGASRWAGRIPALPWYRAALSAAALMLVSVALAWWYQSGLPMDKPALASYETRAAEHRDIELPDGSVISLGAKSAVSIDFSGEQRRVTLELGEALFQVAKDPQRPFVVGSGNRTITAVGTAFNVARYFDRVTVTVTEGVVAVSDGRPPPDAGLLPIATAVQRKVLTPAAILQAGQQVAYGDNELSDVTAADLEVATSWRNGRLKYLGEQLRYVVADVNRYSEHSIRIGDEAVAEMLFTGTVFRDHIDTWIKTIAEVFPVKVKIMKDGEIVLLSAYRERAELSP